MIAEEKKISKEPVKESEPETKNNVNSEAIHVPFVYEKDVKLIVFICQSDIYAIQCPSCQMETRYIVQHLQKTATVRNI